MSTSSAKPSKTVESSTPGRHSCTPGQASIEILVYVGFFLLVFVIINLFFILQVSQDISQRQYVLAQSSAAQVAEDLQLALAAGPGFAYNFSIPASIGGKPYSINITNASSIYVQVDQSSTLAPSPSPSRFFFPFGIRSVSLGCSAPNSDCPGNRVFSYTAVSGQSVREIGFNASKGWIYINNTYNATTGLPQLILS